MEIKYVTNAFKIADVKRVKGKLEFNPPKKLQYKNGKELPKSILKKNVARVYLIVVDKEIKKIGGSNAEGGIEQTLNEYRNSTGGQPGRSRVGIADNINKAIDRGKEIEVYMIYQDSFKSKVKGLSSFKIEKKAYLSYKLIEDKCLEDYKLEEGRFPDWNKQENAKPWSYEVRKKQSDISNKKPKRKTSSR